MERWYIKRMTIKKVYIAYNKPRLFLLCILKWTYTWRVGEHTDLGKTVIPIQIKFLCKFREKDKYFKREININIQNLSHSVRVDFKRYKLNVDMRSFPNWILYVNNCRISIRQASINIRQMIQLILLAESSIRRMIRYAEFRFSE